MIKKVFQSIVLLQVILSCFLVITFTNPSSAAPRMFFPKIRMPVYRPPPRIHRPRIVRPRIVRPKIVRPKMPRITPRQRFNQKLAPRRFTTSRLQKPARRFNQQRTIKRPKMLPRRLATRTAKPRPRIARNGVGRIAKRTLNMRARAIKNNRAILGKPVGVRRLAIKNSRLVGSRRIARKAANDNRRIKKAGIRSTFNRASKNSSNKRKKQGYTALAMTRRTALVMRKGTLNLKHAAKRRLMAQKSSRTAIQKLRTTARSKQSLAANNNKKNLITKKAVKFGKNDLVYGPSAGGSLRRLQIRSGGKLLNDIPNKLGRSISKHSLQTLKTAAKQGRQVRFDLTHMKNIKGILKNKGQYSNTITAKELAYIRKNWNSFKKKPKFYKMGKETPPPWK